ncbi:MAG TPA: hypothetical protein VFC78_18920 [Tepidisphaeraceae bacterium]|nr:hypothetical protein [Tepidisphaeraceae bacterium]
MAEQKHPLSKESAPDPASSYERANPENEAGMGRMDNNKSTPADHSPDHLPHTVGNKQNPENQLNAEDVVDGRAHRKLGSAGVAPHQPDHTISDQKPMVSGQTPTDKTSTKNSENQHPNSDDYLNGHYPDEPTSDHEILTEESAGDLSDE